MRIILIAALTLSATTALAADCDKWTASMEEDEGGPVMMATICVPGGEPQAMILMTCAGDKSVSIRYLPTGEWTPVEAPLYSTNLEYAMDQEVFTQKSNYEEMDGALVSSTEIAGAMISTMKAQKEMTISDTENRVPSATFTLKGASAAFKKLFATCTP